MRIDTDDSSVYRKTLLRKLRFSLNFCGFCWVHSKRGFRGGCNAGAWGRKDRRNWKGYRRTKWKES